MVSSQTLTCRDWVTLAFDYSAYYLLTDLNLEPIARDSMVAASIDVAVAVAMRLRHSTKRDAYYVRAVQKLQPPTCRVHAVVVVVAAWPDVADVCADYADDGSFVVELASNCHESTNYFAEDPIDRSHAMRLLHVDFVVADVVDAYLMVYSNGSSC